MSGNDGNAMMPNAQHPRAKIRLPALEAVLRVYLWKHERMYWTWIMIYSPFRASDFVFRPSGDRRRRLFAGFWFRSPREL